MIDQLPAIRPWDSLIVPQLLGRTIHPQHQPETATEAYITIEEQSEKVIAETIRGYFLVIVPRLWIFEEFQTTGIRDWDTDGTLEQPRPEDGRKSQYSRQKSLSRRKKSATADEELRSFGSKNQTIKNRYRTQATEAETFQSYKQMDCTRELVSSLNINILTVPSFGQLRKRKWFGNHQVTSRQLNSESAAFSS